MCISITVKVHSGSVGQRDVVNKDSPAQPANSVLNLDAVTGQQVWPKWPGSAPTMTSSGDSNGPQPTNHSDGNDVRGIPGTYLFLVAMFHMALDLVTMVPLIKEDQGHKGNSVDNYRAISISPVISNFF